MARLELLQELQPHRRVRSGSTQRKRRLTKVVPTFTHDGPAVDDSKELEVERDIAKKLIKKFSDEDKDVELQLKKAILDSTRLLKLERRSWKLRRVQLVRGFKLFVVASADQDALEKIERRCDKAGIADNINSHIAIRLCKLTLGCDDAKASYYARAMRGALLMELKPKSLLGRFKDNSLTIDQLVCHFQDQHPDARRWAVQRGMAEDQDTPERAAQQADERLISRYVAPLKFEDTDVSQDRRPSDDWPQNQHWSEKAIRNYRKAAPGRVALIAIRHDDGRITVIDVAMDANEAKKLFRKAVARR